MRAPMPNAVRVGALSYRIKQVQDLSEKASRLAKSAFLAEHAGVEGTFHAEDLIPLLGLTNPDDEQITVESSMGVNALAVTLLHETIHACLAETGIRDTIDEPTEESVCRRLAPILLLVLRDNPKLIEYLTNRRVLGKGSVY